MENSQSTTELLTIDASVSNSDKLSNLSIVDNSPNIDNSAIVDNAKKISDDEKKKNHQKIINDLNSFIKSYLNGIKIKNNNNQILNSEVMFVFHTQIIAKYNDLISMYNYTGDVEKCNYYKQQKINLQTTLSQLELQTVALINKAISIFEIPEADIIIPEANAVIPEANESNLI